MNGDRRTLGVLCLLRGAADLATEALASVRAIADEIVLVDCRDRASSMIPGAIRFPWTHDYAAARRFALKHARTDWVLWLEPGELISPSDAERLRRFVDQSAQPSVAYLMDVPNPRRADEVSEVTGRLRLHARTAPVEFRTRLGEAVPSVNESGSLRLADISLQLRASDAVDRAVLAARADERIKLARSEIADSGVSAHLLCAIGDAHALCGEAALAERAYREALVAAEPASLARLEAYHGLSETAPDAERRLRAAIVALDEFPCDAQTLIQLGRTLDAEGETNLATEAFCLALEHGKVHPEVGRMHDLAEIAAERAAQGLEKLDRPSEAVELLQRALEQLPESRRLRRRLTAALMEREEWEQAAGTISGLARSPEERRLYEQVVRGAAECRAGRWISAIAYLETAFEAGCRDSLCAVWLQRALAGAGCRERAEAIRATTAGRRTPESAAIVNLKDSQPGSVRRVDRPHAVAAPLSAPALASAQSISADSASATPAS